MTAGSSGLLGPPTSATCLLPRAVRHGEWRIALVYNPVADTGEPPQCGRCPRLPAEDDEKLL